MVIADLTSKGVLSAKNTTIASLSALSLVGMTGGSNSVVFRKLSSIISRCQKPKPKKKNNSE